MEANLEEREKNERLGDQVLSFAVKCV